MYHRKVPENKNYFAEIIMNDVNYEVFHQSNIKITDVALHDTNIEILNFSLYDKYLQMQEYTAL
jgi:hypothetical protein